MFAPRRVPPCFTASVDASYSFMNDTGPIATPVVERTIEPLRRRREKRKPVPPPALMDERHRAQRVVDAVLPVRERVLDGQHEARRELAERTAGVHERRRVRLEPALRSSGGRTPRPASVTPPSLAPYRRSASATTVATRQNISSGVSVGLPLRILHQIALFENGARVLAESSGAGRKLRGLGHVGRLRMKRSVRLKRTIFRRAVHVRTTLRRTGKRAQFRRVRETAPVCI